MVGQHYRLNRHEFEQTLGDSRVAKSWTLLSDFHFTSLGDSEGQGSLVCCRPWDHRVGPALVTEQQQHGNSSFNFLRQSHTVFHSGCTSYIPTSKTLGFPLLHTPTSMYPLSVFFFFFFQFGCVASCCSRQDLSLRCTDSLVVAHGLSSCSSWS